MKNRIISVFSVKIHRLIAWTHAGDGGFVNFCKDFLEETANDEGEKAFTCAKDFTLENVRAESAQAICQYRSRFAVEAARVNGNILACKWRTTGERSEGHYIKGHCYKVVGSCTGGWELLPLTEGQAFRWSVLIFAGDKEYVVKVKLPKNYTEPTVKYSLGQLLPLAPGEKPTEQAVVFSRMSAFGGHPGDIVYVEDGEGVLVLKMLKRKNPKTSIAFLYRLFLVTFPSFQSENVKTCLRGVAF